MRATHSAPGLGDVMLVVPIPAKAVNSAVEQQQEAQAGVS
jgi:hypothetical protein